MLKKMIIALIGAISYLIITYFLAIQLAYFLSFHYDLIAWRNAGYFCFDPKIMWFQGNDTYFLYVSGIIFISLICMLLCFLTPSRKEREQRKRERMLNHEEKMEYTHIASIHEAKKGLERLQFNHNGYLCNTFSNDPSFSMPNSVFFIIGHILITGMLLCAIDIILYGIRWFGVRFNLYFLPLDWLIRPGTAILLIAIFAILFALIGLGSGYLHEQMRDPDEDKQLITGVHIRDYADFLFNPHKHLWNLLMIRMKSQDVHKMNETKYWKIGEKDTCRRSGIPILTSKRKVWVDPSDSHTCVIGTTNSGKTYSFVHPFIEICRMAGTSMFINDLKGELFESHAPQLIRDGYKVLRLDFVNPESGSECWNPFGEVARLYREAENAAEEKWINQGEKEAYYGLKLKYLQSVGQLESLLKEFTMTKDKRILRVYYDLKPKADELKKQIQVIENAEYFPHPDFNDVFEQLEDITRTLCEEKDSKQPFFWQQAKLLMEGCVCFLLEHEYVEDGKLKKLDINQINFKNINLLTNEGFTKGYLSDDKTLLEWYLENFRKNTDKSYEKLNKIIHDAPETRGSVMSTFANKIALGIMNEKIEQLTSRTTIDFNSLDKQKTAIFLVVHDEKTTYYPFVTIFVTQLYNALVRAARKYPKQFLPIPWDIIWDEFGISPAITDADGKFSASRFRGIRWHIVIQDYSQIEKNYGKEVSKSIKQNVQNTIYLLGGDPQTLKEISDKAGKKLRWNKERQSFDTVPVISPDRLQHFSLSEALILRQRKMPIVTRYYNYAWYIFQRAIRKLDKIRKTDLPSKLQSFRTFSLVADYDRMIASSAGMPLDLPSGGETPPKKKKAKYKNKDGWEITVEKDYSINNLKYNGGE